MRTLDASSVGRLRALALAFPLLAVAPSLHAQAAVLPPSSVLKHMSFEELMDIQVTSVSKRPERLMEAASAVQVISDEDIRRSGATSIPEALRLAGNLEVARIDSRQWAITARGFNNVFADKMLVLIDGRSVYTPLYAGVYWDVQDTVLEDVQQIEVISGPGATQWGSNAVNGVINISTKSAKDTQGGLVSAGLGSDLKESGELRYGGVLAPHLYYRVYAKAFERAASHLEDGSSATDGWNSRQAGFRMDYDAGLDDKLTLQGDAYVNQIEQRGPDTSRANGGNVLGRWTRSLQTDSELKLQAYLDHTHRNIPGSFAETVDTFDLDFQHRLPFGQAHDFVWGLGYRLIADDIVNTPAEAFLPASVDRQLFSGFVQDEIAVVKDRFHVTVGSKLEHNDYTGFEFEPSLRLAWTPGPRQTIWGAVSRAVRTPSRVDHDLYSPATPPYRIVGGSNVTSEKLVASELGYRAQVTGALSLSLAAYYNDYEDLRSLEPLHPPKSFPAEASSGLRGESKGIEVAADWRLSEIWRLHASFNELSVHSRPQTGNKDRATRDSIEHDPNQQASLHSYWNLNSKWELDTGLRYVSRISNQSIPAYADCDLRIGWKPIQSLELSLLGQNLLHEKHAEFNSPNTRRVLERGVYGKVTWRF